MENNEKRTYGYEEQNLNTLGSVYSILAKTVDYIFVKNIDPSIARPLKDTDQESTTPTTKFTNDIVASLLGKNLRDKFNL